MVDDVKEQREIALVMLTSLDYKADAVSSGEEAIEYMKKHTVDLIVLDMIMDLSTELLHRGAISLYPGKSHVFGLRFSLDQYNRNSSNNFSDKRT